MSSTFQKKLLAIVALYLALQTAVGLGLYLQTLGGEQRFGGDFICFWAAARRASLHQFAAVYEPDLWRGVLARRAGAAQITWFVYPPFSLFGLRALGQMSYGQAVAWWSLVPLTAYVALFFGLARRSAAALRRVRPREGDGLGLLGYAAVAAMSLAFLTANLLCGQTGAIIAVLLLGAALCWSDRPLAAGVLIGLLAVKPQLGLLLPLALAAAGRWRTILSAAATVAALVATSLAWAGPQAWSDYLRLTALFGRYIGLGHGQISQLAVGPYVSLVGAGAPIPAAAGAQALVSLGVVVAVVAAFRRAPRHGEADARLDLRLGLLAAGALLATPYALSYDTPLLGLAVVPLFVRAWRGEWDGWELAALTALAVSPFIQQLVGEHVPFGLGALLLGFAILARRLRLEGAGQPAPQACADARLTSPQTA